MKSTGKILGMLLLLLIAGNGTLKAQRSIRGMLDTTRLDRPGRVMDRGMGRTSDSIRMRGTRPGRVMDRGMGRISDSPRMRGTRPGSEFNIKRGPYYARAHSRHAYGRPPMDRMGSRREGQGRLRIENIPNLTEKQKKDIFDLRQKQQDEMKKLRSDMSAKMQKLTESHRNNLLDQLTDEQKKLFESPSGNPKQAKK